MNRFVFFFIVLILAFAMASLSAAPMMGETSTEQTAPAKADEASKSEDKGEATTDEAESGAKEEKTSGDATGYVQVESVGGVMLHGHGDVSPGASVRVVIFPGLGETRDDFKALIGALGADVAEATIHLRGTGKSTEGPGGARIDYRDWSPAVEARGGFKVWKRDVAATVEELAGKQGALFLVGSRATAGAVAQYVNDAGADADVSGIVLLSPGKDLKGLAITSQGFDDLPKGALIVRAEDDLYTAKAAEELSADALEKVIPGESAGAALLQNKSAAQAIADFVAP